jgi:hypothetical protein
VSLQVTGRNAVFCARDTGFSAVLGVSLRVVVWIAGFCARDTGFSAVFGVSLRVVVQNAGICARDTGFFVVLGVSLRVVQIAVRDELRMLDGGGGEDIAWLSGGQSDFESHDVVVHVVAVSDVEVALAEDAEAEVMVEADRRIVAVHVQFDSGFASTCSLPHMSDRTVKQGSAESVALF